MTSTRKPKNPGFQNLSQDPAVQGAENNFASQIEDLMSAAGIPVVNQLHILSQAQTYLTSQQGQDN